MSRGKRQPSRYQTPLREIRKAERALRVPKAERLEEQPGEKAVRDDPRNR